MRLAVIDIVSESSSRDQLNEDAVSSNHGAAWVIDGATDLGPPELLGSSGAAWLSNELNTSFHDLSSAAASVDDLVRQALTQVQERFLRAKLREPTDRWELPFAAFMIAKLEDHHVEFAWLADCIALVRGRDGDVTRIGARPEAAEMETREAGQLGRLKDQHGKIASSRALEHLRAQRNLKNRTPETWLLGVEPEAAEHLNGFVVECSRSAHILLMTDGLSAYVDKYALGSDEDLFSAALSGDGLAGVLKAVREQEQADVDCVRFPRYKRSDDASGILLALTG